jgi:hypothetical protein
MSVEARHTTFMSARRHGVSAAVLVFGLFLGLQVGASFDDHDHATVADGIECVVCHGVRVAPPAERPAQIAEAPATVSIDWVATPVAPTPAILSLTGDPPRGPPAA